jgi:hypothetical protein
MSVRNETKASAIVIMPLLFWCSFQLRLGNALDCEERRTYKDYSPRAQRTKAAEFYDSRGKKFTNRSCFSTTSGAQVEDIWTEMPYLTGHMRQISIRGKFILLIPS